MKTSSEPSPTYNFHLPNLLIVGHEIVEPVGWARLTGLVRACEGYQSRESMVALVPNNFVGKNPSEWIINTE